MQLYREMDIGTAKPDMKERQGVPHHLFDVCEPAKRSRWHGMSNWQTLLRRIFCRAA